jgi:ADP-heptose:LPS heptosyltransferase
MKKLLIISLRNEYDLIGCSYLVSSYLKANPHTEVSILTYKDFSSVAKIISNVTNVYTIDRQRTQNLYQNPLFSKAFAINMFLADIDECSNTKWDRVINFSNDMVSSYLTTYFSANEVSGITVSQTGTTLWSNDWASYLNFYYPNQKRAPIQSHILRHLMGQVSFEEDSNRLKINSDYMAISSQNFLRVRQTLNSGETYIVALSLRPDSYGNRIDTTSLCSIIETLESSEHYKPVLLLGPNYEDRELANQLNMKFDNKLISISSDYDAITSVLSNIDILVSTANNHLYIADALDVKLIQIKSLEDKIQTPSFVMSNNYLVIKDKAQACFDEVCYILNKEFCNELPVESVSNHSKIYQSINDEYSTYFTQISGEVNIKEELEYHISRAYHFELIEGKSNNELLNHLRENTDRQEMLGFIEFNKTILTSCVKTLLATLRSLKGIRQSSENRKNFISYLDELITYSTSEGLVSCSVTLFAAKIENISETDPGENLKEIEKALFQLKTNLQKLTAIFEGLMTEPKNIMHSQDREAKL